MDLSNGPLIPEAALPHPQRPTLLIADDEAGPRESLKIVFRDRYHCQIVTGGRAAIEYARAHPVDIAVLDIAMPDMQGTDVLRELKQIDADMECIMLTGYETLETARAAVRYGATDYLSKPFDVFSMRDLLDKCLARRQRKRAAAEKLRALETMNEEYLREMTHRDRLETASAMSAAVVHELNNPLSVIAGYAHMLTRDLRALEISGERVSEPMLEKVASIEREIDRCTEIARRFLNFARGHATQETELVDVNGLLNETAALLQAHPAGRYKTVTTSVSERGLFVRGRRVEITQILMNLGLNGLQAMSDTGVLMLTAERANAPRDAVFRSPAFNDQQPLVRVSVIDNGHGVATTDVKQLFRPYFTTKPQGTGLGLAVVSELVGAYGGLIDVHSLVGKGTTFNLYLPLATETRVATA
jgi:signal transduction histidine kinase